MRINDLYRQAATPTDATAARPSAGASAVGGASVDSTAGAPVKVTVSSKALELLEPGQRGVGREGRKAHPGGRRRVVQSRSPGHRQ